MTDDAGTRPRQEIVSAMAEVTRRFRLLEARGLACLAAADYPTAAGYADLLDTYHHFLMSQVPAGIVDRSPLPFAHSSATGDAWIGAEGDRLNAVWRRAWSEEPARNLFALAFWATAQYDGLRAAVWLLAVFDELFADGGRERPDVVGSLMEIVESFTRSSAQDGAGIDLYVALQAAADAMGEAGSEPLESISDYRPRPLWDP